MLGYKLSLLVVVVLADAVGRSDGSFAASAGAFAASAAAGAAGGSSPNLLFLCRLRWWVDKINAFNNKISINDNFFILSFK
jgi:hypothetical protein